MNVLLIFDLFFFSLHFYVVSRSMFSFYDCSTVTFQSDAVYTNHEIEKESDCAVPSSQSSTKKLPLAITTRRYPLDRLQTTSNITDPYITTGGLCETTFLELNDPSANLDVNFIEFKQHPNQQQQPQLQQHQHQQQQQQLSTLSKPPSQYPALLNANGYEMEIMPTDLSLYGSSCKPSQGKCYLSDTNDFVGVGSLDILQGVRQGQWNVRLKFRNRNREIKRQDSSSFTCHQNLESHHADCLYCVLAN